METLVHRYNHKALAVALAVATDQQRAADIVEEAFLPGIPGLSRLLQPSSFEVRPTGKCSPGEGCCKTLHCISGSDLAVHSREGTRNFGRRWQVTPSRTIHCSRTRSTRIPKGSRGPRRLTLRPVAHLTTFILMLLLLACPDDGSNHGISDCKRTDPVECPGFDRTFGSNGWVTYGWPTDSNAGQGTALTVDGQGRPVAVGRRSGDSLLWRFDTSGAFDPTFGSGGAIITGGGTGAASEASTDVLIDTQGRIVVLGRTGNSISVQGIVLRRFEATGSLDTSFGTGGTVFFNRNPGGGTDDWPSAIQSDAIGNLIVAGATEIPSEHSDALVVRFAPDGALDPTFGGGGFSILDLAPGMVSSDGAADLVLDSVGRIVLVGGRGTQAFGGDLVIARLDPSGTLDTTFGIGGMTIYDSGLGPDHDESGFAVALDVQERILAAGYHGRQNPSMDAAVWRFDSGGTLDPNFGTGGLITLGLDEGSPNPRNRANAILVDAAGRIIVDGGDYGGFCLSALVLWRLDDQGRLDPTFGCQGAFVNQPALERQSHLGSTDLAFDPLGRIVVVGWGPDYTGLDLTLWRLWNL